MTENRTGRRVAGRTAVCLSVLAAGTFLPAGAAHAVDFGVWMYDWDQDGQVDPSTLDITGDGYLDANLVQFLGDSGYTWLVDLNQNGEADLVGHDADRDLVAEVWFLDADEDDRADAVSWGGRLTTPVNTVAPGTYATSSGGGQITLTPNPAGGMDIGISPDTGLGYGGPPSLDVPSTLGQPFPGNFYGCVSTADFDYDGTVDCLDRSPRDHTQR